MRNSPSEAKRWGVQRRLEFIDFRLLWYGRFTRKALAHTFGISSQQASADIHDYKESAPDNLVYDAATKTYLRAPAFVPKFVNDAAERYLLQAAAVKNDWMALENTWFEEPPRIELVELRAKRTPPAALLLILDAIRDSKQVQVEYASLTGSPAGTRTIAPHYLFFSMGKWYARSWSKEHNDFRDYNLGRIEQIGSPSPCSVERRLDYEWIQRINLQIVPNPKLPEEKRAAVAAEYGMVNGQLSVPCRLSMTFYLMNQYNLNIEHIIPEELRVPEAHQLLLTNREAVEAARNSARQMAKEALARGQA